MGGVVSLKERETMLLFLFFVFITSCYWKRKEINI